MMFLTEPNIAAITTKQYTFKLKAYAGFFSAMAFIQFMALLFSLGGISYMSSGWDSMTVSIHFFSGNMIIAFTMAWAFMLGISLTTKSFRYGDFAFVSNRLSSNLANIAVLLTASIVGGVTAMAGSFLLKVITFFFGEHHLVVSATPQDLLIGTLAAVAYVLLLGALGYFCGMLTQLSKIFIVILPAVIIGSLFGEGAQPPPLMRAALFYGTESSLSIFMLKVMLTVIVLFFGAILISNRMEVSQ
jgi:hypothetical protein